MPNDHGVTVTIGRNIGDEPMPQSRWNAYGDAVRDLLKLDGEIFADATYNGWWDYVSEDARVFVATTRSPDRLRLGLAQLAEVYRQDAVGLQVGTTELVHPALSHLPVRS